MERREPTGDDPAKIVPLISSPAIPLTPSLNDFHLSIPGIAQPYPFLPTCQEYLQKVQALVQDARQIAIEVHTDQPLTDPPEFF
jgi:hypothetical protein